MWNSEPRIVLQLLGDLCTQAGESKRGFNSHRTVEEDIGSSNKGALFWNNFPLYPTLDVRPIIIRAWFGVYCTIVGGLFVIITIPSAEGTGGGLEGSFSVLRIPVGTSKLTWDFPLFNTGPEGSESKGYQVELKNKAAQMETLIRHTCPLFTY